MSITCDCSQNYGDMPEFCHDSFPVARKSYVCCECGEVIKPGQKYHKVTGKWDGEFSTFRTCMACYRIREDYCPHGYVFGELANAISECFGFDYRETQLEG